SSSASLRRPARTTAYPSRSNASADALPMPDPAPVMTATLLGVAMCECPPFSRMGLVNARSELTSPAMSRASGLQQAIEAIRRHRHLVDLDAERRQRVGDGVRHGRRGADGPALRHALEAAHARRRRRLDVAYLHRRHVQAAWDEVVHEARRERLPGVVVREMF